jgi:hypothetical protein
VVLFLEMSLIGLRPGVVNLRKTATEVRLSLIRKGIKFIMSSLRVFLVAALSLLAGIAWTSRAVSGEVANLVLNSQPGSFIGQGQDWNIAYTPQNSEFFSAQITQTLPSGQPDFISFTMGTVTSGSDNTFATLDFSTVQLGTPLQPGTYDNAERAAFADPGHPGLDVTFQNRGSNVLTGSFTINELSFFTDPSNTLQIESFSVSYQQSSDNNSSNISGTFTFNANAVVPEPGSLVLLSLGTTALAAGGAWSRFRRSAPRSRQNRA